MILLIGFIIIFLIGFVVEDFTMIVFFAGYGFGLSMDLDLVFVETVFLKPFAGLAIAGFNQKGCSIFLLPFLSATMGFKRLAFGFSMDDGIVFTITGLGFSVMGCSWGISSSRGATGIMLSSCC